MFVNILGLDLSLNKSGYVVFNVDTDFYCDSPEIIKTGTIYTKHIDASNVNEKLKIIGDKLSLIVKRHSIKDIAIERTFNRHAKSSQRLWMSHGVFQFVTIGIPHSYISPGTWKKAISGSGKSTKEECWNLVAKIYPNVKIPNDDISDAICVGLCHIRHRYNE